MQHKQTIFCGINSTKINSIIFKKNYSYQELNEICNAVQSIEKEAILKKIFGYICLVLKNQLPS